MTLPDLKLGDKGHIAAHKTIRERVICALDYPSIQAAVNSLQAGEVFIPDGVYDVSQVIILKPNVDLVLSHGATLRAVTDTNVVKLAWRGGIRGGSIDCTIPNFSKTGVLVDGDTYFYLRPTIVSDVVIYGNGTGTGIRFRAKQQIGYYPHIFGVTIHGFTIEEFEKGIWMQAEGISEPDNPASINANSFSNGYINSCNYAIFMNYIDGIDRLGVNGNLFENITIQPNAESIRALYCEGNQNMFSNFFVWDWTSTGQQTAIELTGSRNTVITNRNIAYVTGSETNKVITPDT